MDKVSWLFNDAPVGIIFINKEAHITDCNNKVKEFLNLDRETIIYQNIFNYIKRRRS